MKPDVEYWLGLLTAVQNAPNGTTDILELEQAGWSYKDPKFEFHIRLLHDEGLIESDSGGIGLDVSADGAKMWSAIPLRITAAGQAQIEGMSACEPTAKVGFEY